MGLIEFNKEMQSLWKKDAWKQIIGNKKHVRFGLETMQSDLSGCLWLSIFNEGLKAARSNNTEKNQWIKLGYSLEKILLLALDG